MLQLAMLHLLGQQLLPLKSQIIHWLQRKPRAPKMSDLVNFGQQVIPFYILTFNFLPCSCLSSDCCNDFCCFLTFFSIPD